MLITTLEKARRHIYNKLRRCDDPIERAELLSKRDDYTTVLTALRKDVRVANYILDDNDEIVGYEYVNMGKFMDAVKAGTDPNEALKKEIKTYGRFADAAKYIDPRKE